ncbi:hypothetical protein KBB12_01845 [Candidatus Woesebacteria bacterium]|nr:hypothetical protein [Candidatus Woesebacteria bacterium]
MTVTPNNASCMIVAGPCSVDANNLHEILEIARMTVSSTTGVKQRAIAGTRVVGMKSRTELSADGKGMGMDYEVYKENLRRLIAGKSISTFALPPSAKYAIDIFEKTKLLIATEVCSPILQLTPLSGRIPKQKMLPWNPAVDQLGWPLHEMASIARQNDWHIGIKNGKWLGESIVSAESPAHSGKTPLEKVWSGLGTYTQMASTDIFMIQRGIEIAVKGDFRSIPIHSTAKRIKRSTHHQMLFDPSHSLGPKMRMQIVAATIDAMRMKMDDGSYLYDGALIEVGTSLTDTKQHINLQELQDMCDEIARFRDLVEP